MIMMEIDLFWAQWSEHECLVCFDFYHPQNGMFSFTSVCAHFQAPGRGGAMLSLGRAAAVQQQQQSSQPAPQAQPLPVLQTAAATPPQQGSTQPAEPQAAGIV